MAVALLERNTDVLERTEEKRRADFYGNFGAESISDEQHNARIGETYKRLINPDAKVEDILDRTQSAPVQPRKELFVEKPADKPYLVENARADSLLFRADNPINRKLLGIEPIEAVQDSEEENEDLRPTPATIQYKTTDVKTNVEECKAESVNAEKRESLSKKEKIIIAVVVSVIVAIFALIIINSAILSGLNTEMSTLQTSLDTVKSTYVTVSSQVENAAQGAVQNAERLAESLGLIK